MSLDGRTFVSRTVQVRAKSLSITSLGPEIAKVAFELYVFPESVTS